jgi:hypothetical protein
VDEPIAAAIDDPPLPSRWRLETFTRRTIIWLLIVLGLWIAFQQGLRLRRWAFELADPIRFVDDTARGFAWGLNASGPEGYLNQYDKMQPEEPEWQNSLWVPWMDYVPLRLLVMRQWAVWQRTHYPLDLSGSLMDVWQRAYWFSEPVLRFNTAMEFFAAVCAFFLTRLWVIRGSATKDGHFLGVWQGIVASLAIWFSPDIIICAHCWFQWDAWVVPWYLCACLLASLDWWFAAGLAVAIGIMFKGQMLTISPIFIIWPIVQGRFGGAVRWICGFGFGVAAITSGWLITYLPADRLLAARNIQSSMAVSQFPRDLFAIPRIFDFPAAIWVIGMLIVAASARWLLSIMIPDAAPLRSRRIYTAGVALLISLAVYWPWLLTRNRGSWYVGLLAAMVVTTTVFFRLRNNRYVLAAIFAAGMLSCISLFHGGTGWWDCGFHYGSIHWPWMAISSTCNLPAIFQSSYGWAREVNQIAFTVGHFDVTAKMFFNSIYGVLLLTSGIAIGMQARRNDRRMLVALVTPWLMFFIFPVQIQERYLLYGAGAAMCCIGNSVGTALLGLFLSLLSAAMQLILLLEWGTSDLDAFGRNLSNTFPTLLSPQCGRTLLRALQGLHPDIGWALLVVGMIFLYLSLTPSRSRTV